MVSLRSINIHSPLSTLSKFAIICMLAVVLFPIDSQAQADLDTISYHAQDGPKVIQDNGGYDGRTVWEINLTGAPADAVIRSVDIEYWVTHTWVGDLKVWLTTEDKGEWIEYVLWDRQSGNANDIHEKETGLSTWNDLPVNRKWYLCAADYVNMDEGRMDSWKIWVYFDRAGVVPQFVPYYEDFTEGKPDRSQGWEYYSNNRGRIAVVDGKLRMDDEQDGFSYSLNEAMLHLDLSERSGVTLTLNHESSSDENTSLPSRFTGHLNGDGIAISPGGLNWYLVTNLTSSFNQKSFDLDPIVQAAGISYTSDFRIKFQQYDNYGWSTDGRAFDNISITATGADPQSRMPFGLWNGTFNSTTYGVAGSINDWIMREDYTTQAVWELTVVPGTGIKVNPSGTLSFNPLNDRLSFLYTGQASILNDGQIMEVPGTLNVQGTVFRNRIEGNYTLRLSPPNLPSINDNGTLQVNKEANVALHVFGIEMSTGWNFNDPETTWNDLMYDFSLGLETDNTVSFVEFQTPKGYTLQIPSDSYTQVGDVQTWHYPVETTSPVSSTLASGLVAYWTMDDDANDATVTDSSGKGNHGTARQNTSVLSTPGKFDSALTFNGSSDYIDCGNDSSLDITDNISISAWVRFDSLPNYQTIVAKRGAQADNDSNYALRTGSLANQDEIEFYYRDGTNWHVYTTSNANLTTGQWYHVVVTYTYGTGTSIKCYVNGNVVSGNWTWGNGNTPTQNNTKPVTIGGLTSGERLNGAIDSLMIVDRMLSETEISTLYAGQQPVTSSGERWDYKGKFSTLDELDKYSDGTYTIKVYYKDGTQDRTTVRFGIPGATDSIPQPTNKPVLTSPKHNSVKTSPVTFRWEPCNDVNATSVSLHLENQDTGEYVDIKPPVGATSSDPIPLSGGMWQAQIFCESWYDTNNLDSIDISVGKYSESDYIFNVVGGSSGLVAHWKMDDNAANTTVTDSSGKGNHGTARRNTSVLSTPGKIDGALTFNGSSDYINCGNNSSLDITGSISISGWVRFDSLSSRYQTIVAKRGSETNIISNYALRTGSILNQNQLEFYYYDGSNWHIYSTSNANLTTGQWYHAVVTFTFGTGTGIKCYLNNNLLSGSWTYGNGNSPVQTNTMPVTIGGLTDKERLHGVIDKVMIFNRTLSGTEISTLYNG